MSINEKDLCKLAQVRDKASKCGQESEYRLEGAKTTICPLSTDFVVMLPFQLMSLFA